MFETITPHTIINLILIGGLFFSYLTYRIICKVHRNDPNFEEKEKERVREMRKQQEDNEELDRYLAQSDSEYADNDESPE